MPSTYNGLDAYHASIVIPSDGDPAVAESVNVALRALSDNTTANRTDIGHQAADDRGKTSTITGAMIWNDGGGSFVVQIDSSFANVGITGDLHVYSEADFQVFCTATFMAQTNFADQVEMASSLAVRGVAEFHSPVQLGFDGADTITVGGDLVVNNQAEFRGDVQLGLDASDQITVGGPLVANDTVTLNSDLITKGDTHFGNAGADEHEFDGNVTMHDGLVVGQDVTIEGDLEVQGDVEFDGGLIVHDAIQLLDSVTLGGSSSDSITFNAKVASPVGFVGAGRILLRNRNTGTGTVSLTSQDGNVVVIGNAGTIVISSTNAQYGDYWDIVPWLAGTSTIQYTSATGSTRTLTLSLGEMARLFFIQGSADGWEGGKWSITRGS